MPLDHVPQNSWTRKLEESTGGVVGFNSHCLHFWLPLRLFLHLEERIQFRARFACPELYRPHSYHYLT